ALDHWGWRPRRTPGCRRGDPPRRLFERGVAAAFGNHPRRLCQNEVGRPRGGPAVTRAPEKAKKVTKAIEPYVPACTCATASAISSANLARISASSTGRCFALRSAVFLAATRPGPSNSAATTSLA